MNLNQKFTLPIAKKAALHKLLVLGVVVGTIALAGTRADALPITGEIHFLGSFVPTDAVGNQTSLGAATGLQFNNPSFVIATSGDFSSEAGSLAWFNDFQFKPALFPSPVNPLWTTISAAPNFAFKLESIAVDYQSSTQINLSGKGVLSGDGFDNTAGTRNFQGGGSGSFTFRADDVAAVPDAGNTVLLLGTVLMGLSLCRKHRVIESNPPSEIN